MNVLNAHAHKTFFVVYGNSRILNAMFQQMFNNSVFQVLHLSIFVKKKIKRYSAITYIHQLVCQNSAYRKKIWKFNNFLYPHTDKEDLIQE